MGLSSFGIPAATGEAVKVIVRAALVITGDEWRSRIDCILSSRVLLVVVVVVMLVSFCFGPAGSNYGVGRAVDRVVWVVSRAYAPPSEVIPSILVLPGASGDTR